MKKKVGVARFELATSCSQSRRDNRATLHPELENKAVRGGFEPPVRFPVRQFSKLLVSATHPPHRWKNIKEKTISVS